MNAVGGLFNNIGGSGNATMTISSFGDLNNTMTSLLGGNLGNLGNMGNINMPGVRVAYSNQTSERARST